MDKIKYKKISEGIYEKISYDDVVIDTIKLENLKETKTRLEERLARLDALIKQLEELV